MSQYVVASNYLSVSVKWESWPGHVSKGEVSLFVHFCIQECYCQEQRAAKVLALMFQSSLPTLDTHTKLISIKNKASMTMLSCLAGHQTRQFGVIVIARTSPKWQLPYIIYLFFPVHGKLFYLFCLILGILLVLPRRPAQWYIFWGLLRSRESSCVWFWHWFTQAWVSID